MKSNTNGSSDSPSQQPLQSDLLTDEQLILFNTINLAGIATVVATFGVVTNIINIIVFAKQGFGDTVNVSLMTLAISDLCSLITLLWLNLLRNPLFFNKVPFMADEVQHLTGGWPHAFFAKITSWITVYITFERCLCVALPLKVKRIVTPKLAVSVFITIFLVMLLTLLPELATSYLDWRFVPEYNRTMLGLKFLPGRETVESLSFTFSGITLITAFFAIILFTTILVVKIKQKANWRKATSSTGSGNESNKESRNRDNRTVKMIILIAVMYCTCFLPMMVTFTVSGIMPGFIIEGRYHNVFLTTWSFAFACESVNSSINIFVYYNMSSKFRSTLDDMLKCIVK